MPSPIRPPSPARSAPNVLVVRAHPRRGSLSDALAAAYVEGAEAAGACVQVLTLADLDFRPDVTAPSPRAQGFEDDLRHARSLIRWADHLVFVYPTWWGTVPALLKAFLDRVLTNGFAFDEVEGGTGYVGRLGGRSAHLVTTMDTPRWVYRWLYGSPGHRAMKRATLRFCGVSPVRVTAFGPVRHSDAAQRTRWLARVRAEGARLRRGRLTRWERARRYAAAWLRAARLQFYPMTWIAYTVGALAAGPGVFTEAAYWIGYAALFFLEFATVLTNDVYDVESDRANPYYGPFSGGSRVLVDGTLSRRAVLRGAAAALGLTAACAAALLAGTAAPAVSVAGVLGALAVLALGYTVPPLKLSHRGLGEVDVALTHSLGVILCGYVFQGGAWHDPAPWLLSVPLFLAVLPSILLAGLPDVEADRAAGKATLVVELGPRRALDAAAACTVLATAAGAVWHLAGWGGGAYGAGILLAVPHGAALAWALVRRRRTYAGPGRLDRLIAAALAFILWFGLVPLFGLP